METVQRVCGLSLYSEDGSSHPCPPLDCLKRCQSDHTCHHPHRFNDLAKKKKKKKKGGGGGGNGKLRLAYTCQ